MNPRTKSPRYVHNRARCCWKRVVDLVRFEIFRRFHTCGSSISGVGHSCTIENDRWSKERGLRYRHGEEMIEMKNHEQARNRNRQTCESLFLNKVGRSISGWPIARSQTLKSRERTERGIEQWRNGKSFGPTAASQELPLEYSCVFKPFGVRSRAQADSAGSLPPLPMFCATYICYSRRRDLEWLIFFSARDTYAEIARAKFGSLWHSGEPSAA